MDRQFSAARLASGILFSAPADINAKPDVWSPKEKRKPQKLRQFSMKYGAESQDSSSAPMMRDEDYSQFPRHDYSLFPQFINMTTLKPLTDHVLPNNGSRSSVSSPASSKSPVTLCLPILRVSVDVSIDGTISRTTVTQSFHNPSDMNIPEARHTFPLYYNAVVTSFECKIGDSRRLRGVVKSTAQARREFEESKKKKREAAVLLEELTPEIFETSLGNIAANTTVEIILTYVHELKVVTSKEEKSEGLAVIIPASAAPRYASAVAPSPTPEVPSDQLEITIRASDDGTINPACCHVESNHPSTTYHGIQPNSNLLISNIAELHNFNSATSSVQKLQHVWKYSCESQPILKGDFVFVIQMLEETRLRSHAVITPANDMGHAALMVSLRPNDLFGSAVRPDLFKGEILFVLDRSGSMDWTQAGTDRRKIETMRNAMSLALSGLPSTCRFNIISFGSEVRGMWNRSRRADEPANMLHAREYLTTVKADMRGTEVLLALKGAVNNHDPGCLSTQIILITDGEINREPHSSILKHVWETRKIHGEKIRFFTLGIGDSVSHSVLESVAELGGGYCDVVDVVKRPRWEGCLNRMLRSVMEPDAWTCEIDLGPGYKRQSLAVSKFGIDDGDDTDLILYAQGPDSIPSLQPFRYKSFFFLLDLQNADLPKSVTIKTTADSAKQKAYTMEVRPIELREGTIHPLAVKTILRSLENEVKRTGASEEQARLNAEYLGTKYAIASNWTSFIAVVDGRVEQACQIDTYKSLFREADIAELLASESGQSSEESQHTVPGRRKGQAHRHHHVVRNSPFHAFRYDPQDITELPHNLMLKSTATPESYAEEIDGDDDGYRNQNEQACQTDTNKSHFREPDIAGLRVSESEESSEVPFVAGQPSLMGQPGLMGNGLPTHHKDVHRSVPLLKNLEASPDESIIESRKPIKYRNISLPSRSFNSRVAEDQSHLISTTGTPSNPEKKAYSQDGYAHLRFRRSQNCRSTGISRESTKAKTEPCFDVLMNEPTTINATPPDTQVFGYQYGPPYDAPWEIVDTQGRPPVLKHEDVLFYRPSRDGHISWQDAAGCEDGGMFVLPVVVRERLRQHFCGTTAKHLQKALRDSSGANVAEETAAVLIDTLMMIEYFKTHLANEEDYWNLIIDKAERALLLALGYGENRDEALEPFYKTLLSSILHVHFPESLKHASVYQEEADRSLAASAFGTCLVCNMPIETDAKEQLIINKGYTCLADECYDGKAQCRKTYTSWKDFWDHQVQSGHLLCPEIDTRDDAGVNESISLV
ncbi:uncharacterized protein TrAtP1_002494 [Trichoderma atroviride]|uniref:uncharacterized protein n=1 Tax=Hypocrea atroviridis TaxID=63577 RepID=UPI0033348A6C|nr:hypothetical protein TrAtP1_002494 [Trichoderma atroviride]